MSSEKKIHIQGLNMENKPYLKPVIIDTDPGDDDSASILWVLASGKFDVKALTVTNGNVGVDKCVINALRVLEVAGRTDIPVYKGAYRPLVRQVENAEWIHGNDGLGDVPGLPLPETRAITRPGSKWICWKTDLASSYAYWKKGELTPRGWMASLRGRKWAADIALNDPLPALADMVKKLSRIS